jgi:hypothetical protein
MREIDISDPNNPRNIYHLRNALSLNVTKQDTLSTLLLVDFNQTFLSPLGKMVCVERQGERKAAKMILI